MPFTMNDTLPRLFRRALVPLVPLVFAAAATAQAAPLAIGVSGRADDARLDRSRVELGYLGQPLGSIEPMMALAIEDTQFELEAAKLEAKVSAEDVDSAEAARALAVKLEKSGHAALVVDWPAAWITAAASAVKLPIFNAGESADALRQQECRANVFHTLPSERMRADAVGQWLVARKWRKVLVLHGPSAEDRERLATVQGTLKRYGLQAVAAKAYKLSADPRERDLANPLLLTAGLDYDALWVVDSDGEFARTLPYRISLPRPVVGDAGLTALAWMPRFERFGAPQVSRRLAKAAERPIAAQDWAAWMAGRAVLQAALAQPRGNVAQWRAALLAPDFSIDGSKGARLSFRPWDRQLRQPMLLTDGVGVIATAPIDGLLHPRNVLDTLGADGPEKLCKAAG
jgi:ABC transporter substrate binding protein (PQQ-dependent alcohol dehydrogenase system)